MSVNAFQRERGLGLSALLHLQELVRGSSVLRESSRIKLVQSKSRKIIFGWNFLFYSITMYLHTKTSPNNSTVYFH